VLVGDGPLRNRLERDHPGFIFCGERRGEDLAAHYASGDMLLFPSRTETFGNFVTEGMASGLAVVACDEAAAHAFIRDQENGVLATDDSPDRFASVSLRLCKQPWKLRSIGERACHSAIIKILAISNQCAYSRHSYRYCNWLIWLFLPRYPPEFPVSLPVRKTNIV